MGAKEYLRHSAEQLTPSSICLHHTPKPEINTSHIPPERAGASGTLYL